MEREQQALDRLSNEALQRHAQSLVDDRATWGGRAEALQERLQEISDEAARRVPPVRPFKVVGDIELVPGFSREVLWLGYGMEPIAEQIREIMEGSVKTTAPTTIRKREDHGRSRTDQDPDRGERQHAREGRGDDAGGR
jgi:hypothetical protein